MAGRLTESGFQRSQPLILYGRRETFYPLARETELGSHGSGAGADVPLVPDMVASVRFLLL